MDEHGIATRDEADPQTLLRALGSVLAHELRTPLTTIYAGAELLAAPGLTEETKSEASRSVVREAQHLHRTIEDLVVLVRWDLDPPQAPEPLLVQHILRDAIHRSTRDAGATVDLSVQGDLPPIMAARANFEHVVRNLVAHAVANTPPDARVGVEARPRGTMVEIAVRDAGPGLDATEAAHAFDLFAGSSRTGGDPSGANLALVVARRIVERMGGRIRAVPRPSGGEIVVQLPTLD